MLLYTAIIGPINFLILRRINRRELAWITIPALVLLFSAITFFTGLIDLRASTLRFANAGHNDPLLHDGARIIPLHDGSIALGMMPNLPFLRIGEMPLPKEGTLLCYTDGLVEQEDAHGHAFEDEPLIRALSGFSGAGPDGLISALKAAFEAHRGAEPYLDDIAVLCCRFR